MIYFNNRNGSSGLTCRLILFLCILQRGHKALRFLEGGEGSGHALTKKSKGT